MPKRNDYSLVVDAVLDAIAVGGITFTALVAPNAVQLFDKPIRKYLMAKDKAKQEQELRKLARYLRQQHLVTERYQHGLVLTDKARKRLEKRDIEKLRIDVSAHWDGAWKIVFYDIPETHKKGRDALAFKLRQLGCYQLQRSVWVHPYGFYEALAAIASAYGVDKYVTYLEANHIHNQPALVRKFAELGLE